MTWVYVYCLVHMSRNPQQWTTVHKCGPYSTTKNHNPEVWTKVHMDYMSVNAEHVQSASLSLASINMGCNGSMITIVIHFLFGDIPQCYLYLVPLFYREKMDKKTIVTWSSMINWRCYDKRG